MFRNGIIYSKRVLASIIVNIFVPSKRKCNQSIYTLSTYRVIKLITLAAANNGGRRSIWSSTMNYSKVELDGGRAHGRRRRLIKGVKGTRLGWNFLTTTFRPFSTSVYEGKITTLFIFNNCHTIIIETTTESVSQSVTSQLKTGERSKEGVQCFWYNSLGY